MTVAVEDGELVLPEKASPAEAAAIVAAVGTHLSDQQRAAAVSAADASSEYVDEWTLDARLARFGKRRRPRNVRRGDEWKAAARARY